MTHHPLLPLPAGTVGAAVVAVLTQAGAALPPLTVPRLRRLAEQVVQARAGHRRRRRHLQVEILVPAPPGMVLHRDSRLPVQLEWNK
jgi:hypothetical protein